MKQNQIRFLLSCVLALIIGGFLYYLGMMSNAAFIESTQSSTGASDEFKKTAEEPKTPYELGSIKRDLTYCNGQLMDIYHPRVAKKEKSPVVLYIHGGGWAMNDKNSEPDQLAMIDGLRDSGFTIASINYRKLPDNFYPSAVQDSLCAVRYIRAEAATYGVNPDKIAIYGFSAGGYLAGMVGALPDDSAFETPQYANYSSRVGAVVTLAGIFDFTDGVNAGNQERIASFLNGASVETAEVTGYITSDDPSFLLLHGANDQYVSVEQDNLFAAILQKNDIAYEQIYVKNAEHGLNPFEGQPVPDRENIKRRITDFIQMKLDTD